MSLAGKCIELEITMLNETNPTQKFKYCMFSLKQRNQQGMEEGEGR